MSYGRAKTLGKAHLQDRVRASPLLLQLCFRRHVLNLLGAQHAVAYFNAPAPTGSGTELAGPASLQTYFKLTSKLTINAGIRWDFEPPRTERFNRQIFWDKDYPWDWQPNAGWTWDLAQQQAGGDRRRAAPMALWLLWTRGHHRDAGVSFAGLSGER